MKYTFGRRQSQNGIDNNFTHIEVHLNFEGDSLVIGKLLRSGVFERYQYLPPVEAETLRNLTAHNGKKFASPSEFLISINGVKK